MKQKIKQFFCSHSGIETESNIDTQTGKVTATTKCFVCNKPLLTPYETFLDMEKKLRNSKDVKMLNEKASAS